MTDAEYSEIMKKKMNSSNENESTDVKESTKSGTDPYKIGHVTNCVQLNVREHPSQASEVLEVLQLNDQITVDVSQIINGWEKVKSGAGVNGYCMQKYITM